MQGACFFLPIFSHLVVARLLQQILQFVVNLILDLSIQIIGVVIVVVTLFVIVVIIATARFDRHRRRLVVLDRDRFARLVASLRLRLVDSSHVVLVLSLHLCVNGSLVLGNGNGNFILVVHGGRHFDRVINLFLLVFRFGHRLVHFLGLGITIGRCHVFRRRSVLVDPRGLGRLVVDDSSLRGRFGLDAVRDRVRLGRDRLFGPSFHIGRARLGARVRLGHAERRRFPLDFDI